jgi:hypothetical protein
MGDKQPVRHRARGARGLARLMQQSPAGNRSLVRRVDPVAAACACAAALKIALGS